MELISPTELAKEKVLAVQEYTLLAIQSVANVFRKPLYLADMVQQGLDPGSPATPARTSCTAARKSSAL